MTGWIRRTISLVTASLVAAGSAVMFSFAPAAATEHTGYWKLCSTQTEGDSVWQDGWDKGVTYKRRAETGTYTYTWECTIAQYGATSGDLLTEKGTVATVTCTNSAPPSTINGGDTVSLTADLQGCYVKNRYEGADIWKVPSDIAETGSMSIVLYTYRGDTKDSGYGYAFFHYEGEGDGENLYTSWEHPSVTKEFTCTAGTGSTENQLMIISVRSVGCTCDYYYKWHDTTPKEDDSEEEEEEEEQRGYWKRVESGIIEPEDKSSWVTEDVERTYSVSEGSFYYKLTHKGTPTDYKQYALPEHHRNCGGEYVEQTLSLSQPGDIYRADQTASLKLDSTVTQNTDHIPDTPVLLRTFLTYHEPKMGGSYPDDIRFTDTSKENYQGSYYGYSVIPNGGFTYIDGNKEYNVNAFKGVSDTISAVFPAGQKEGQKLWLVEEWAGFEGCWYQYQWVDEVPPETDENGMIIGNLEKAEKIEYYWKYDGTKKFYGDSPAGSQFADGTYTYDNGTRAYRWNWKKITGGIQFHYKCLKNEGNEYDAACHEKEECKNEFVIFRATAGKIKTNYKPGEKLNLTLTIDAEKSKYLCQVLQSWEFAYLTGINPDENDPLSSDGRETALQDASGESQLTLGFRTTDAPNEVLSKTVTGKFPKKAQEGDVLYVTVHSQAADIYCQTGLRFVFTKGTPAAAGTVGLTGGNGSIFDTVDTDAWQTPGEDGGISVPVKILLGAVGAAGTAAGAAAAAGSAARGNQPAEDDRKKKSQLRMYVQKDFGDAIRKGTQPVGVFARIAEVKPDGTETPCNELSEKIVMRSGTEGLTVSGIGFANGYQGAEVSFPDEKRPGTDGVVSISFSGAGGSFTQNVHFRLIGRAYLEFPADTVPETMRTQMVILSGDGKEYQLNVRVCDFAEEPTSLSIDKSPDNPEDLNLVGVSFEKTGRFTYLVRISNYSPEEKEKRSARRIRLMLRAENQKESAEETFPLFVCPEGISVLAPPLDKEGRLVINTEDADPGEQVDIKPTEIQLVCAYRKNDEVIIETKDFKLGQLQPTDEATFHVLNEFTYEINDKYTDAGRYYFNSRKVVPTDPAKPYIVTLPVSHPAGGLNLTQDLPILLDGEPLPTGTLLDRDEEWEKLVQACQRYGLSNSGKAKELIRAARGQYVPASVLRQIRYAICFEARQYYSEVATEMTKLGDKMDRCATICAAGKWLGDQAVSYLIKYYCKGKGDLVEIIVMPFWDVFWPLLGSCLMDDTFGGSAEVGEAAIKAVSNFAENSFFSLVTSAVGGGTNVFTGTDYGNGGAGGKKIAGFISLYAMTNFCKHYWLGGEEKGKIWESMCASFKDITINGLKAYFSNLLGNFLTQSRSGGFTVNRPDASGTGTNPVSASYLDQFIRWFFKSIKTQSNNKYIQSLKDLLVKMVGSERAFFRNGLNYDGRTLANANAAGPSLKDFDPGKLAGTVVDALLDVILNSTAETISAKMDGKDAVVKIGDAEFHFSIDELVSLIGEMPLIGGTIKQCCDWICGMFSSTPASPEVVPFTEEEEVEALRKLYSKPKDQAPQTDPGT